MRVAIQPGYVMPVDRHIRDPYVCELGIIVRGYAPLTLSDWRTVSTAQRQILLDHLSVIKYKLCYNIDLLIYFIFTLISNLF